MQQFRDAIESRDIDAVVALFTHDITFRSPVVHTPYQGRAQVGTLLRTVGKVLEDFRYTSQIGTPEAADHALVFTARIGERDVEGCDFIHVNDDGLIDELYVMFRPLSGVMALAEAMKRQLELAEGAAAG
jgi:limonene-1,2-epoxide hydrolase